MPYTIDSEVSLQLLFSLTHGAAVGAALLGGARWQPADRRGAKNAGSLSTSARRLSCRLRPET